MSSTDSAADRLTAIASDRAKTAEFDGILNVTHT